MTRHSPTSLAPRRRLALCAAAFPALVLPLLAAPARAADTWQLRPLWLPGSIAQTGIAIAPDGTITAGAQPIVTDPITNLAVDAPSVFVTLRPDGVLTRLDTTGESGWASFAAGADGTLYEAATAFAAPDEVQFAMVNPGLITPGTIAPRLLESTIAATTGGGVNSGVAVGVDTHGVPAIIVNDIGHTTTYARFDVPSGRWTAQPVALQTPDGYAASALTFAPDGTPWLARSYNHALGDTYDTNMAVSYRTADGLWVEQQIPGSSGYFPVSEVNAADGGVDVFCSSGALDPLLAHVTPTGVTVTAFTDLANYVPLDLAIDPAGHLAALVLPSNIPDAPILLLRQTDSGEWQQEPVNLPAGGASLSSNIFHNVSLAFDAAGNPVIAAGTNRGLVLLGTDLSLPPRGDFNHDNAATAADVPLFAAAAADNNAYLAAHPDQTLADIVTVGDYTNDLQLTPDDARAFCDSTITTPISGLANRTAAYAAFDSAAPNGNYFHTTLATGAAYAIGDSRADLAGAPTVNPSPDGILNWLDIQAVFDARASADLRADLNDDGQVTYADALVLTQDILHTTVGDLDTDGRITPDDYLLLDHGFLYRLTDYHDGDLNGDGVVNELDYALMDQSFRAANPVAAESYIAAHAAEFGPGYRALVPEPATLLLVTLAAPALLRRRR